MPIATRTFRVFVSSTFEDLKAERDVLQREVFPKLRTLCERHGARFQAIDLRWGVRDEAALDQKAMDICLREIERCQRTGIKPNFIVLLGQRYGWRPLPSRIKAREFQAIRDRIADSEDRVLVESWYRRDDNALPPEYLLKSRVGEWVDTVRWQDLEATLREILLDAARAAGLSEQALVKYEASATHQEILKGLGATPEERRHVFTYCRDVSDEDCDPDLVNLKNFLRAQLSAEHVLSYEPGDFAKLCQDVERTLRAVIESQAAGFESRPALALEMEAHDAFARERALVFGREEVLSAIGDYVRAGGGRPLVLHGASGSGKSAVMAQASERAKSALASAVVIRRFIGASPESSSGLTMLRSLCEQIGEAYGIAGDLPVDFNGVTRAFRERLAQATHGRPLVIFLDALDQMNRDDPARPLAWLGGTLPPHCRIVASSSDLAPALDGCSIVELEALPQADAAIALDHWLEDARRRLQPAQRERLLAAFTRCGLPLYLKLALEEARGWASYQSLEECPLGEGVEGEIDTLLNRLSLEANHGPVLVSRGLGYLAAARYGLTEDEMLDVLSADEEVWRDFERRAHHTPPERRLPVIVWSRLFLDLEPYLAERAAPGGTVVSFYHRQLPERVAARFLAGNDRQLRHRKLAEHFAGQSNWLDRDKRVPNLRRLTEMVRHQVSADLLDEAEATLTDLGFASAKCCAGLVFDSQEDYRQAIAALPEAEAPLQEEVRRQAEAVRWTKEIIEYSRQWTTGEGRPALPAVIRSVQLWSQEEIERECRRIVENPTRLDRLRAFAGFVEQESYPLLEFGARPGFVVQHGFNHAPCGPVHEAAERARAAADAPLLTRAWSAMDRYNPKPALLRTLEGHTDGVGSVSVTPDGRRAVSAGKDRAVRVWDLETGACLRVLEGHKWQIRSVNVTPDGGLAVSAGGDRIVRVWDLETGTCLHVLKGHKGWVRSVSVTPDGRRAVSAGDDGTVRVWDLATGACLRVLKGHTKGVNSVSMTPDSRRAVSASGDGRLRLWDLETGVCLRVLEGHTKGVSSVSVTPDGRRAVSAGWDDTDTVQVWDLETGACLRVLKGHMSFVNSVSVTPDSRCAVSASDDNTLRVWDLETGACLRVLEGHTADVSSVSVMPDGRRAVSASEDKTVRVWDLEMGACLQMREGRTAGVLSVSVTPDSRRVVSASWDKTVRVWDLQTGSCLRVLEGHNDWVRSVSVTPDGRRVVSGGDNTVRVWDLETGACLGVLEGHVTWVNSVVVTPDCRRVVSASWDQTVRVWDLERGICLRVLKGRFSFFSSRYARVFTSVSVTPDSRRVVSASSDGKLRVWDLETGACLQVLKGHTGSVNSVSVTPDGRRVVSASWDKTVRVWDLETGECLRVLKSHNGSVRSVSVTPDSRHAVSACSDNTVRVWDLEMGVCVAIARLPSPVQAVAPVPALGQVIVGTSVELLRFDLLGMTFG
jgi:WD40 repeat protein